MRKLSVYHCQPQLIKKAKLNCKSVRYSCTWNILSLVERVKDIPTYIQPLNFPSWVENEYKLDSKSQGNS